MWNPNPVRADWGWLADLDRARKVKERRDTLRQMARRTRKPLPKWAQAKNPG